MQNHDPYWQFDLFLGEGVFSRKGQAIRMLLHVETSERYYGRQEIVPITQPEGERTSVQALPYSMLPLGLCLRLGWLGKIIHRVMHAPILLHLPYRELGDCHAWYYHQDRLLLLWDCYLYDRADPRTSETLRTVWNGFELFLLAQFPDTQRIATPSWEPVYKTKAYQAFLTQQGYSPFNTNAFLKKVNRANTEATKFVSLHNR
jgi:hypothetical protein